mmetsp:Transcript_19742/g.45447  ORF Transcript_19742/g.45447 Transcript_19742/m.45447 type:complete len:229 (-) Transcript_19742:550-1236(-)
MHWSALHAGELLRPLCTLGLHVPRLAAAQAAGGADDCVASDAVGAFGRELVDRVHDVDALDHLAEDSVPAIEVRCGRDDDGEMARVGVGARIGGREQARLVVLKREAARIVVKGASPHRAHTLHACLINEFIDDPVEAHALKVVLATPLAGAHGTEVLCRARRLRGVEDEDDPAGGLAVDLDVEVHSRVARPLATLHLSLLRGCGCSLHSLQFVRSEDGAARPAAARA